jgi:putative ABC transport system permease protein
MLDLALKNLWGHKVRSALTILGIVIAIASVVAIGSISAGINDIVQSQLETVAGKILVQEQGAGGFAGPPSGKVPIEDMESISELTGVESVAYMLLRQSKEGFFISGVDFDQMEILEFEELIVIVGRWSETGEYGATIGYYIYDTVGLDFGDSIEVEGEDVEIVGVIEQTDSFIDYAVVMSLQTAQELFDDYEYVTMAYINPESLDDIDSIVDEVNDLYPNLEATSVEAQAEKAKESIAQIQIVTVGIALVAALVAFIGIINTMVMSVFEQRRQIGVKKAIGASRQQILTQVLEEGLILGMIGGLIGLAFGYLGSEVLNQTMGMPLAKVTFTLAAWSFSFAVGITILASIYPALQATKVDPIEAIRGK